MSACMQEGMQGCCWRGTLLGPLASALDQLSATFTNSLQALGLSHTALGPSHPHALTPSSGRTTLPSAGSKGRMTVQNPPSTPLQAWPSLAHTLCLHT